MIAPPPALVRSPLVACSCWAWRASAPSICHSNVACLHCRLPLAPPEANARQASRSQLQQLQQQEQQRRRRRLQVQLWRRLGAPQRAAPGRWCLPRPWDCCSQGWAWPRRGGRSTRRGGRALCYTFLSFDLLYSIYSMTVYSLFYTLFYDFLCSIPFYTFTGSTACFVIPPCTAQSLDALRVRAACP